MFHTGLVSISFRNLSASEIIEATKQSGLEGIEWGGDVHVPAGNLSVARQVGRQTTEAGLKIFAYGSYYCVGCTEDVPGDFLPVLHTALALGAPIIRIWAHNKGSESISEQEFNQIVQETQIIADMAKKEGVMLSFECHPNTCTDEYPTALRLIKAINRENVTMYWQPNQFHDEKYNLTAASEMAAITTNIHTFHWDSSHRYPLAEGKKIWSRYIRSFLNTVRDHAFLLEFMHDGDVDSLINAALVLQSLIKEIDYDSCLSRERTTEK